MRPKEGETYFDVVAVIDPVTREAQRLAPLLLVGMASEAVHICPKGHWPCDSLHWASENAPGHLAEHLSS